MSNQLLDQTSAKAFRAAKLRYLTIVGAFIATAITCIALVLYHQDQKNKLAKVAKEYAEINSLYYQENLQDPKKESPDSFALQQNVNHDKSMALFSKFALKHATEPYGWQAAIRTANYYINQGNIQAAKELCEAIIPHTIKFPLIQIKLGTVLAGIYTEQNEAEKAIQQIEYTSKFKINPMREKTELFQAQILYIFGRIEAARQILTSLTSEQAKIWSGYLEK